MVINSETTMELKDEVQDHLAQGIEIVALQPVSVVDHLCRISPSTLRSLVKPPYGGSHRVPLSEIQRILSTVGEYNTKAGGSASNCLRALAALGVACKLVGARGKDEWGNLFNSSMKRAGVNMDRIIAKSGSTGRCCILVDETTCERTMRTCLDDAARLDPSELELSDFAGAKFVFLSGYILYNAGLLERAVELATAAGCQVALDLASFEVVRSFRKELDKIIKSGVVAVCFCNEDEATEWAAGQEQDGNLPTPEKGLELLSQHCSITVVTLGAKGCLVKERSIQHKGEVVTVPACSGITVEDTTGAGDVFSSGFLFSLLRGYPLKRAAEIGCLAGGAVVQQLGAELSQKSWQWLHSKLHGTERAAEAVRSSAVAVQQEMLACYALIEKLGRGIVYYGSARLREGSSAHWQRARRLGAAVAELFKDHGGVTTWSGGGPGMMEAASLGAMDADAKVGGIRIGREAGTRVLSASYLPDDAQVVCKFLSSRKVALTDSGVRMKETDKTAFIFLPGGLGTMDELFEVLCLVQLRKLGSRYPVPIILCNFSEEGGVGFYDGLLTFIGTCVAQKVVGTEELEDVLVASDEDGVLESLRSFYGLYSGGNNDDDASRRERGVGFMRASSWVEKRHNGLTS